MQVDATTFLIDTVRPPQKVAPSFEEPKAKTQVAEIENVHSKEIDDAENLEKLKTTLAENNITLKFSRDETTKAMVVELVNDKTGEAIFQMPSEVSLKLAAIFVKLQGQFIDANE